VPSLRLLVQNLISRFSHAQLHSGFGASLRGGQAGLPVWRLRFGQSVLGLGRELYLLLQRLPPVIVGVLPSGQACYVKGKKPAEQTRARTVPPIDNNVKGDNVLRKAEWSKFKRGREDH
jgi:hypothetical protein